MINIAKSQPTSANVHVDRPLTNISVAYIQDTKDFVADRVFKSMPSDKQSNLYYVYSREFFFQGGAELQVSEGSPTLSSGFGLETDSYVCKVYGFSHYISDEARANSDEGINLEHTATLLVTNRLMITKEKIWADIAFKAEAWANSKSGATTKSATQFVYWSEDNSDPIIDIRSARKAVKRRTGLAPNIAVITEDVYERLTQHPKVVDRFKYTTNQVVTEAMLAKLFDLDEIIVSGAVALPSNIPEGKATDEDYDWIMQNGCLLLYVPKTVSIMQAAAGYGFYWTNLQGVGSSEKGIAIKRYRREHIRSDVIEGLMAFTYKIVCRELGYFMGNCLASS